MFSDAFLLYFDVDSERLQFIHSNIPDVLVLIHRIDSVLIYKP
ncbi:MAG: hypothetical protein ACI9MS_001602 [Glaciecola sp.]|jgi:hypothetical protein